ncbi:hypothetical protein QF022_001351 [Vogesella perlucida]|nr:hypothetical protein [Vogesella perlucida]
MHIATKIIFSDFDASAVTDAQVIAVATSLRKMVDDQILRLQEIGLIAVHEEALA